MYNVLKCCLVEPEQNIFITYMYVCSWGGGKVNGNGAPSQGVSNDLSDDADFISYCASLLLLLSYTHMHTD